MRAKRANFEKSDPQIIDFSLGNHISGFTIVKKNSPAGTDEKLAFGGVWGKLKIAPTNGGNPCVMIHFGCMKSISL